MADPMAVGKKMMEKWGWKKGQGIGKDKQGMTSCLVLRKQDGSLSQGRIEMSAPMGFGDEDSTKTAEAQVPSKGEMDVPPPGAAGLLSAMGLELGVPLGGAAPGDEEPEAKRKRSKWEGEEVDMGLYDIDPRDLAAGTAATPEMLKAAAAAAAEIKSLQAQLAGGQMVLLEKPEPSRMTLQPPKQRKRVRQWVMDDWRWSKGTETLWHFEEVKLNANMMSLARKVLGEGSRYPARIADDTDCLTEVTAWDTLLVRPRGSGANVALAKRMLFEVLQPHAEELREEVLITPDEMAEAAVRDLSTITTGLNKADGARILEGVERAVAGRLRHVGIGAEDEAKFEATQAPEKTPAKAEIELATTEDAELVKKHLQDIRTASGATPVLVGMMLKLFGKLKPVIKAEQLVKTLIETGEWVAMTEGFVMSDETRQKLKANEGPSEQILIKVAEGQITQKIEKHLKSMERAAMADQLKLTSKAVAGKRTLMVEGTKAAHERVKLMVRELATTGESPMLNKALGFARSEARPKEISLDEILDAQMADLMSSVVETPERVATPSQVSVGPALNKSTTTQPPKPVLAVAGLAGGGIRHLPPPKLAAQNSAGTALFAGLPAPDFPSTGSTATGTASFETGTTVASDSAPFPPLPPKGAGVADTAPPSTAKDATHADVAAAGQELAEIMSAVEAAPADAARPAADDGAGITE